MANHPSASSGQRKRMRRKYSINKRSKAWQSMRILRRFKLPHIVATAEISENNCAKYIRALRRCGYLRVVKAHHQGKAGGGAVYALIKNTGPNAPLAKAGFVFDPNTGEEISYG